MTPEWVSAVADLVSSVGVLFGLFVACKQISTWRKQQTSTKRAEIAEEVLLAAYVFDDMLRHVRAAFTQVSPLKGESADEAHLRSLAEKHSALFNQLKVLHLAGIRCRAVLANQVVDDAIHELTKVRYDVLSAPGKIKELQELNDFPKNYLKIATLRNRLYGSYHENDELGQRQVAALAAIDRELCPIINHAASIKN